MDGYTYRRHVSHFVEIILALSNHSLFSTQHRNVQLRFKNNLINLCPFNTDTLLARNNYRGKLTTVITFSTSPILYKEYLHWITLLCSRHNRGSVLLLLKTSRAAILMEADLKLINRGRALQYYINTKRGCVIIQSRQDSVRINFNNNFQFLVILSIRYNNIRVHFQKINLDFHIFKALIPKHFLTNINNNNKINKFRIFPNIIQHYLTLRYLQFWIAIKSFRFINKLSNFYSSV